MVQIGNEIICGMLWNDGRICEQYNTPQQWTNLGSLLKEGISGVNDAIDVNDSVKIMIHTDRGGDNAGARWFYDGLLAQNVSFDIIGLSYYPWWQGTLIDLQNNLNDLSTRYSKEIVVVETAYPWTLSWNDNTTNLVGNSSQLLAGYPAAVQGQKDFLVDLINIVSNTINGKGSGVFYWEPDWISTQTFGSPWENLALFDFSGELLTSIYAFDSTFTDIENIEHIVNEFQVFQNYPNPFNPTTMISWQSPVSSWQTLKVFDVLGNEVATLVNEYREAGSYEINFNGSELSSGMYFYKLHIGVFVQTRKMTLIK
jgi:arabinogalactan endo-1,4-beta-galactosidase